MPITYSERITIAMGMSASQARLLTITGKLTDNELRSQTITNSKLRLAQKSSEASQAYMDALNTEKLTYKYYNDNGESASYNLTPALIYSYEPLKNQYSIQNASGQNLVSATDAKNYEETDNLADFLKRYNLLENVEYEETVKKTRKIEVDVNNPAWQTWKDEEPKETDSTYVIPGTPGTHIYDWQYDDSGEGKSLYEMFINASEDCYGAAVTSTSFSQCYQHVLCHMLDLSITSTGEFETSKYPKQFTTSTGDSVGITLNSDESFDLVGSAINGGKTPYMLPISDVIRDGYTPKDGSPTIILMATAHPSDSYSENTAEWSKLISDYYLKNLDTSENPMSNDTKLKILLSNYKKDSNGNISQKTLREKCVDMLYVIKNLGKGLVSDRNIYYTNVMVPLIKTFQEDLQITLEGMNIVDKGKDTEGTPDTVDTEKFKQDHEAWEKKEPPKTIKQEQTEEYEDTQKVSLVTINDKDKAQWYVNLWYMMNGSETANKVSEKRNETLDKTIYQVDGAEKNLKMSNSSNYKVIDDQLFTSNEWLTFALKNGIVTLKQASYFNPATDSGKVAELNSEGYFWNSTAYSSTTDIVAVEDEVAIAKAEVKYKNTTTEIENQDKKYDQDLKKLDSEHNALQTEYESLKSVIDKNVERSFKAFS